MAGDRRRLNQLPSLNPPVVAVAVVVGFVAEAAVGAVSVAAAGTEVVEIVVVSGVALVGIAVGFVAAEAASMALVLGSVATEATAIEGDSEEALLEVGFAAAMKVDSGEVATMVPGLCLLEPERYPY